MPEEIIVALAGNPNVGKSTVFNALTGLRQHTGNWPGKTVASARGRYEYNGHAYLLIDLPGTYSLMANSREEEIARDFLCFGEAKVTVVVADATCLERNLNLVYQVMELTRRVVLCVNLLDEAGKKKIRVDLNRLSERLGIPVVGTSARGGKGLSALRRAIERAALGDEIDRPPLRYSEAIERAVDAVEPALRECIGPNIDARWLSLRLLEGGNDALIRSIEQQTGCSLSLGENNASDALIQFGLSRDSLAESLISYTVRRAEALCAQTVYYASAEYNASDRRLDHLLTSKRTGIPVMLLLLFGLFWITLSGANYPSMRLSQALFSLIEPLRALLTRLGAPEWLNGMLTDGAYRTLAWVVSVMLPPMAIFFPLFTLLEDFGYLPRVAFNLDHVFQKARAHGKQALTMCMGLGCNACAVVGCRIIDSPRERLIAMLTNAFIPCNGRFPTMIALISMFFVGTAGGFFQSVLSTAMLTGVIVLGVMATLLVSRLLSCTVLKGMPSSFQLELPPFRRPQVGKVIVRSVIDRTLRVLARAVAVAAPAGLLIWIMANARIGEVSALSATANFLDPFARRMGLDGYILLSFFLGLPANEIVIPALLMSYLATGSLTNFESLTQLHAVLMANGWTQLTAINMLIFSLMHWPCATTLWTIGRESRSIKWTLAAFLIPTACGVLLCMAITAIFGGC